MPQRRQCRPDRPRNPPPHVYSTRDLDRRAELRADARWLAARRRDPTSLVLPMAGLRVPVQEQEEGPRARLLPLSELGGALPEEAIFLGLLGELPVFAWPDESGAFAAIDMVELRSVGSLLPHRDAGLLAYARALVHWHARHRFCGACGRPTRVTHGGHVRLCAACGLEIFPRTDPAVIVLVTFGDLCLLGRSPRFPPGMYSTLAGFVEPAEGLEDAVRREVVEEVGLALGAVRYRSSQPWPFPQSLMLGFRAEAVDRALRIDHDELEDAAWFGRGELLAESPPVRLPGADSIARFLIEEWLLEG